MGEIVQLSLLCSLSSAEWKFKNTITVTTTRHCTQVCKYSTNFPLTDMTYSTEFGQIRVRLSLIETLYSKRSRIKKLTNLETIKFVTTSKRDLISRTELPSQTKSTTSIDYYFIFYY